MWEPWVLFRKPIGGRVQDNLRKWGTGGFRRRSDQSPFASIGIEKDLHYFKMATNAIPALANLTVR